MQRYFTYILMSISSGRLYIGHTRDMLDRLVRHNSGRVRSTKGRGPWVLQRAYGFASRGEAMRLERYLKGLKSREAVLRYIATHPDRGLGLPDFVGTTGVREAMGVGEVL